jgi:hypothetical protein
MTTQVIVEVPAPNHKRVRVRVNYLSPDGQITGDPYDDRILEHGTRTEFYVHATARLTVDEID